MRRSPVVLLVLALAAALAACDASETHDARFVAVNSGLQTALISGESFNVITKRWHPLTDEVSPGEEVLLRSLGISDDFALASLFRNLTVRSGDGPPVSAMPEEAWVVVRDGAGAYTYTLDVAPLLAQE